MRMRMFLNLLFLLVPLTLFAATVQLPETGQTSCYDSAGNVILCTDPLGIGQDAAEKSGAAWPTPRFINNGNGTVTDKLTGLIWLKNANCFGQRNWADALTAAKNLASGGCGLTDGSVVGDWRLPSLNELESLVNLQQVNNAVWLKGQGFTNVLNYNGYWSASTYVNNPALAWVITIDYGTLEPLDKDRASYYDTWPVRGGQ